MTLILDQRQSEGDREDSGKKMGKEVTGKEEKRKRERKTMNTREGHVRESETERKVN